MVPAISALEQSINYKRRFRLPGEIICEATEYVSTGDAGGTKMYIYVTAY